MVVKLRCLLQLNVFTFDDKILVETCGNVKDSLAENFLTRIVKDENWTTFYDSNVLSYKTASLLTHGRKQYIVCADFRQSYEKLICYKPVMGKSQIKSNHDVNQMTTVPDSIVYVRNVINVHLN